MSVIIDKNTRVLVQGITGYQGRLQTPGMLDYGTNVVAGVTPGKAGQEVNGVPVFDSVRDAMVARPTASIIFVPGKFCKSAVIEALDAGIMTVVVITEHIPFHDVMDFVHYAKYKGARVIGPNTPGIITPGQCKMGIMPGKVFTEGTVGVVSRSGTLTYEIVNELSQAGLGQSTCIGLGGDPVAGTSFVDALRFFQNDPGTDSVVMVGEIGGSAEEEAAEYIRTMTKPVAAYIAGLSAPTGKRMGHAGAIISGNTGTAQSKIAALEAAGARVARYPSEIATLFD